MKLKDYMPRNFEMIMFQKDEVIERVKSGKLMKFHGKLGRFTHHHSARCRGYVSRKHPEGQLENTAYKGRFGEGVTIKTPAYDSTRYCYREYYIFEEL